MVRTSQLSMSMEWLTHPLRAHSTGPAPAGLQNQVLDLKLCRRRSRSPRSHVLQGWWLAPVQQRPDITSFP